MVVAAHKNQKRRGILMALRAVVISSEAERSSLQNGQRAKETLIQSQSQILQAFLYIASS